MWNLVGMKVDIMEPSYHDMVLAITSHIPHIIAYSIVGTVSNLEKSIKTEVIKYAASGFKRLYSNCCIRPCNVERYSSIK